MRIPASLSKNLSKADLENLESQLKHSVLAKTLRRELKNEISKLYVEEEGYDFSTEEIYRTIGRRSGLRYVLNLLPEDSNDRPGNESGTDHS